MFCPWLGNRSQFLEQLARYIGGALPNIDRRHAPVDRPPLFRFALTQWPPFSWKPHPMTPYFHKSHPLPLLLENLHRYFTKNFARFRAHFKNFGNFRRKWPNSLENLWKLHSMAPFFRNYDRKRSCFLGPYTEWPPILRIICHR